MSESLLDGRVALITGTGGGQGRAAALRFAAAGAHVVGCDLKVDGNLETLEMIRATGGSMRAMQPVDLGDPEQSRAWIENAAVEHGRIDVLYNNASAARFSPIEEFGLDDWRFTIRNELDLVFYATRYAWPHLKQRGGVIINTASVAGIAGSGPGGAAHAATKGAVIALTKHLAMEGAPFGIRVVAISPGVVESPGISTLLADPEMRAMLIQRNLIKRVGRPDDIAPLAVFLASDDAGYITGANFVVDGGRVAW